MSAYRHRLAEPGTAILPEELGREYSSWSEYRERALTRDLGAAEVAVLPDENPMGQKFPHQSLLRDRDPVWGVIEPVTANTGLPVV